MFTVLVVPSYSYRRGAFLRIQLEGVDTRRVCCRRLLARGRRP